jgi:hypothetical protein
MIVITLECFRVIRSKLNTLGDGEHGSIDMSVITFRENVALIDAFGF